MEYLECLSPKIQAVWPNLGAIGGSDQFVLVGGSALALQLGHRESVDIDLVSSQPCPHPRTLKRQLSIDGIGSHRWIRKKRSHYMKFRETAAAPKIDIHGKSRIPCLVAPKRASNGLRIASLTDILFHKLLAAVDRRAERDGVDVLALLASPAAVATALDAAFDAAGSEAMAMLAWCMRHPERMRWPASDRWDGFAEAIDRHRPSPLVPVSKRVEGPALIQALDDRDRFDHGMPV